MGADRSVATGRPSSRRPALAAALLLLLLFLLTSSVAVFFHTRSVCSVVDVEPFSSPLGAADAVVLDRTLRTVVGVLDRLNATYFMVGGTLLGSYRHHGRIPWDDDVDLMISSAEKRRLWAALTTTDPGYRVVTLGSSVDSRLHWKFFAVDARVKPIRWPFVDDLFFPSTRWPNVDLMFYDADDPADVRNESPWFPDDRYPRSVIFPLRRRPFDGLLLPAPCNPPAALGVYYRPDECVAPAYSHYCERSIASSVTAPCSSLRSRVPLVERRTLAVPDSGGSDDVTRTAVVEILVLGNRTVGEWTGHVGCV